MPLTLEELVETAVENQHIILQKELEKGIPLNYIDQDGTMFCVILTGT